MKNFQINFINTKSGKRYFSTIYTCYSKDEAVEWANAYCRAAKAKGLDLYWN